MNEPAPTSAVPWYLTRKSVIIALAIVGPLALPLVWLSPRFSKGWKIGLTIATLVLTWLSVVLMQRLLQTFQSDLAQLKQAGLY